MGVDNSGATYVFDANTTQAIEEGKNRITLLQVEELRLSNLKSSLESQIVTAENSLTYKTEQLEKLTTEVETTRIKLEEVTAAVAGKQVEYNDLVKKIQDRIAALEVVETQITDREQAVSERETAVTERENQLNERELTISQDGEIISEKRQKIEDFLKEL